MQLRTLCVFPLAFIWSMTRHAQTFWWFFDLSTPEKSKSKTHRCFIVIGSSFHLSTRSAIESRRLNPDSKLFQNILSKLEGRKRRLLPRTGPKKRHTYTICETLNITFLSSILTESWAQTLCEINVRRTEERENRAELRNCTSLVFAWHFGCFVFLDKKLDFLDVFLFFFLDKKLVSLIATHDLRADKKGTASVLRTVDIHIHSCIQTDHSVLEVDLRAARCLYIHLRYGIWIPGSYLQNRMIKFLLVQTAFMCVTLLCARSHPSSFFHFWKKKFFCFLSNNNCVCLFYLLFVFCFAPSVAACRTGVNWDCIFYLRELTPG